MTAPRLMTKSEIKRAVAVVQETGLTVEIERNGMKMRLMPTIPAIHSPGEVPKGKDVRL